MLIEQPPLLYRLLFPEAIWRIKFRRRPTVFLTFDDGPIPEVTPWVLDVLDQKNVKATFFMVGDNVRRHPELLEEVKRRGHSVGNHTMHHLQGMKCKTARYLRDISEANALIDSRLYRPPHGIMRWAQSHVIRDHYDIVMYDVVTRDYSRKLSPEQVLDNVKRYTRNGSIIVFHDSLKAERNLRAVLPQAIDWLKSRGYSFLAIPME
ncbi:MAG: polysaccharide deacetylase family protein [Bacteroides sp.]|nr:polysaccharide deacetylase family protein [Bacteroidales bacterium]MBD5316102.1 polysaccharide deacetylase family protein [Bacteroides sp.]MBD5316146.1 polysaccharide deacetylase family protein [Bacteroides sp.]